jgi:anaerobic ribonucleoside-triphosphate reductase activating protein
MLPARGGEVLPAREVLAEILAAPGVEGVTFLGGEPFAQAAPLAWIAAGVRAAGLGVIAFSGWRLGELRALRRPGPAALLAACDLLVDGRWERAHASARRRFVGSDNQRVHFLTDRYRHLDDGRGGIGRGEGPVEIRIQGARLFLSGAPDAALARALRRPRRPRGGWAGGGGAVMTAARAAGRAAGKGGT